MSKQAIEEIIKEWEELGYEWSEYSKTILLRREMFITTETIIIGKEDFSYYKLAYFNLDHIDLREHQLLTKTFKALGWLENDN